LPSWKMEHPTPSAAGLKFLETLRAAVQLVVGEK